MNRSVRTSALLVLMALLGVACAAQVDDADSRTTSSASASPSPSPSPSPTSTSKSPSPSPTKTGSGNDGGFVYLPWGPDDPPIPTQYAALAASSGTAPRCDDVPPQGEEFWDIAVQVCRAIVDEGPWPDTTTVPAPPPTDNPYTACLDAELVAMLKAALRWHADHPSSHPKVSYGSDSRKSPCQFQVYEVELLEPEPGDEEEPGAYIALVRAAGVDNAQMTVDGEEVFPNIDTVDDSELRELFFELTADEEERTVEIEMVAEDGTLSVSVTVPGIGNSDPDSDTTATAEAGAGADEEQQ